MESLCLEVFKKRVDVALRDMVGGHGGDGLGLDMGISEAFSNLNGSVIQWKHGVLQLSLQPLRCKTIWVHNTNQLTDPTWKKPEDNLWNKLLSGPSRQLPRQQ